MDAFEIIKDRRSVKKYTDKPVPRELIEKVCRAGTWAATGYGQAVTYYFGGYKQRGKEQTFRNKRRGYGGKK